MKIGIFGMGAVGCSIYEELQEYKELYILVDEERLDKYKKGFIINDVLYHPNLKTNIIVDLLILCVKNYQLKVHPNSNTQHESFPQKNYFHYEWHQLSYSQILDSLYIKALVRNDGLR